MQKIQGDSKVIKAWAFYDWANSVYSLVISTAIFPMYYDAVTEGNFVRFLGIEWEHPNSLYTYALSFSFLIVAIISPILSGIADYRGNKKSFMKFFCLLGSISVMSLYLFDGLSTTWIGIISSILASIGFWGSIVFYNAYLPEIAHPEDHDRVSARGFINGYIGSILLLLLCLSLVMLHDSFGLTEGVAIRLSFVVVGVWWLGFAQITFRRLPKEKKIPKDQLEEGYLWKGFQELKKVLKEVKKDHPVLKRFLIAFFLLSVGVQTIILTATLFGTAELKLGKINLIGTILIIQVLAILGAFLFSRISERFGNIKALTITIIVWMFVCFGAFLLHKDLNNILVYFYILGGVLGLVLGAIQSLARSTYSKLIPETEDHATFFSFFDVTEKIAIVTGTFVYGLLNAITNSMQWSVLSLAIFFFASLVVLLRLKKTKYVS
ncbi:MFS transporter [Tenacibaculum jejuense]|uniref:Major facilitator superfamily permease n=1 Tax=Tenacibaculum jejuense TaxID=584609 RepID=A0A238UAA8_9FLAO|nr:MFS transporter [Tenacibaculum jejuense]SNR16109.1 Major facilitator superfamily permease [Tenacibaculum jejuense]